MSDCMSERFFCKINEKGRNIIVDKDCHYRIKDMYRACDYLNRLDLKLKTYNEQLGEQQATINELKEENEALQADRQRLIYHINKRIKDGN